LTPDGLDVHVLLKEAVIVAPLLLGVIHRVVRVLDQRLRISTVIRVDTDANADTDMEIVLVD
jgi:hypothetical protein